MKTTPILKPTVGASTTHGVSSPASPLGAAPNAAVSAGDVFLRNRALTIRATDVAAAPELKLERANRFLEVLRDGVANEADPSELRIDLETTVFNYHPSLRAAKALALDATLAPTVRAKVDAMFVPIDLRPLFDRTVGVESVAPPFVPKPQRAVASLAQVHQAIDALPYEERAVILIDDQQREWEVSIGKNTAASFAPIDASGVTGAASTVTPPSLAALPDAAKELSNLKVLVLQKASVLANRVSAPSFEQLPAEHRRLEFQARANAIELQGGGQVREWDHQAKAWGYPERMPLTSLREAASIGPAQDYERFLNQTAIKPRPWWAEASVELPEERLAALTPELRAFTQQADVKARPMRLALAESGSLTAEQVAELYHPVKDLPFALDTLVEWAAVVGPAQQQEVQRFFDAAMAEGSLSAVELRSALTNSSRAPYAAKLFTELDRAIAAVADGDTITRDGAIDALTALITSSDNSYISREQLADHALELLLRRDLAQVLPLGEADVALGSVRAKAFVDDRPLEARLRLDTPATASTEAGAKGFTTFDAAVSSGERGPSLQEAERAFPQVAHQLKSLKTRLELQASSESTLDLVATAKAQAQTVINQQLLGALSGSTGEENVKIYRAGRAFIDGMTAWAEKLQLEL